MEIEEEIPVGFLIQISILMWGKAEMAEEEEVNPEIPPRIEIVLSPATPLQT